IHLALRAYPREKFGEFPARIVTTSATPTLPGDVKEVIPLAEAAFIATATIPLEFRGPDGRVLLIKPGMVGEAMVPLERRSLLEWILEPILRELNRSLAAT